MEYDEIIKFHGHECPGLAIGYRMAEAALKTLNETRSGDEEIVAIVENDACGTDAVQCVTGCTFGKGNFIFKDYGKQAYTLYSRATCRGVRVVFHGKGMPPEIRGDRAALIRYILESPESDILSLTRVSIEEPARARIQESVTCERCGESVMKSRVREIDGKYLCIPCAGERTGREM